MGAIRKAVWFCNACRMIGAVPVLGADDPRRCIAEHHAATSADCDRAPELFEVCGADEPFLASAEYVPAPGQGQIEMGGRTIEVRSWSQTGLTPTADILELRRGMLARSRPSFASARRNALCPCGSGRKYKRCHGINPPTVRPDRGTK